MERFQVRKIINPDRQFNERLLYEIFDVVTRECIAIQFRTDRRAEEICNLMNAEWQEFLQDPY